MAGQIPASHISDPCVASPGYLQSAVGHGARGLFCADMAVGVAVERGADLRLQAAAQTRAQEGLPRYARPMQGEQRRRSHKGGRTVLRGSKMAGMNRAGCPSVVRWWGGCG